MEFYFEKFKRNFDKVAVHCKTMEEAEDFRIAMNRHGVIWRYTFWDNYRKETCYSCFYESNNCQILFNNLNYYKEKRYEILEWSDYMNIKKEFTKSDLENGMILEERNGIKRIVLNDTLIGINDFHFIGHFNEDLKSTISNVFDIVKIYTIKKLVKCNLIMLLENDLDFSSSLNLVWEREEKKEMTLEEIENELGYKIKIVNNKN